MLVELTVTHRRLWWHPDGEDEQPASWHVSADVARSTKCAKRHRHVADVSVSLADIGEEYNILDSLEAGDWSLEFIAETVLDLAYGALVPELDHRISSGPDRMLILNWVEVAPAWRGHGLAPMLTAAVLERFASTARLGVCRLSPADFMDDGRDRISAELTSVRLGGLLERIGFFLWNGVYIVDLRNPALVDASLGALEKWGPYSDTRGDIAP
jgi:GNAT superfamily N-acetyltransferase